MSRRNSQVHFADGEDGAADSPAADETTIAGPTASLTNDSHKRGLEPSSGNDDDSLPDMNEPPIPAEKRHHSSPQSLGDVVLRDVLCEERDGNVITITHNTSVGDAMKILARNKILSAPVVMEGSLEDGLDSADTYLGMVDVLQLLQSVLREFSNAPHITKLSAQKQLEKFTEMGEQFANRIVYSLASNQSVNFVWRGTVDQPLLEVINGAFLKPTEETGSHVHRIAIFNQATRISNVLTQSDVIRYLYTHLDLVPLAHQTVENLALGSRKLVTVSRTTKALDAFKKMLEHNLTGVPVLDGEVLVSNLSASDLRGVTPEDFPYLVKPVEHFLLLEKSHPSTLAKLPKPITCTLHDTLAHVLQQFVEHRVHRIYIVNEQMHPLGVITMTDVLRLVSAGRHPAHQVSNTGVATATTTTTNSSGGGGDGDAERRSSLPGIRFVHGGTALKTNEAAEVVSAGQEEGS